jgi:hypothetical protein
MQLKPQTTILAMALLWGTTFVSAQQRPYCRNQVFGSGYGWCWGGRPQMNPPVPDGGRCNCICKDGEVYCPGGDGTGWPTDSVYGVECTPEMGALCPNDCWCSK